MRSLRLLLCALVLSSGAAVAQESGFVRSGILVLDTERLFNNTLIGQRLVDEFQAEREQLITRNRDIEAELRAEEQALTDKRPSMKPAQFRAAADAFDAKVRKIRQESEQAGRELERAREIAPLTMMQMAQPILVELMRESGGQVILDNRQVLLRADVIDITDTAIARIDAAIGDGSGDADADASVPAPEGPPPAPEGD